MEVIVPSDFGTITFGEPKPIELPFPGDPEQKATSTPGQWYPPEHLAPFLPVEFSLSLDCVVGPDGQRHIVPNCNFEELVDVGAVIGPALLRDMHGFGKDVDKSYRAMHLILQYVRGRAYRDKRGVKEHLTRKFNHSRDLFVRTTGRVSDDQRDVLPDDVGLDADGEGQRFSGTQLTETGRQAAREAGYRNPISEQAIPFGLFEAAQRNPLEVEADRVPALVQMSLFDIDLSQGTPSEEVMDAVAERLLDALDRHLDDTSEAFEEWFSGTGNSLIKQIAQQKGKPGGRLKHADVRQALLRLGWQSYEYVGQCVDALMRAIKNSMPTPLNGDERQLFEQMYESQPCYGNLPLALLTERSDELKHAVLMIWNDPDNPHHVGVLHRLLAYYADMVRKRRQADRQAKQRSKAGSTTLPNGECPADPSGPFRNAREGRAAASDQPGVSVPLIDNLHGPSSARETPFSQVAEHIRELYGVECDAGCGRWDYRRDGGSKESVRIAMRCGGGHVAEAINMTVNEFAAYAEEVLQWEQPAPDNPARDGPEANGEN